MYSSPFFAGTQSREEQQKEKQQEQRHAQTTTTARPPHARTHETERLLGWGSQANSPPHPRTCTKMRIKLIHTD